VAIRIDKHELSAFCGIGTFSPIGSDTRFSVNSRGFDIFALMRIHPLTLDDGGFATMVVRHGGDASFERIKTTRAQ